MPLDMDKTLRDQDGRYADLIDFMTPSFNHTHQAMIGPQHASAKDLNAKEVVAHAHLWQREWMRKNGLI